MKVKELIEQLQHCDPEAMVCAKDTWDDHPGKMMLRPFHQVVRYKTEECYIDDKHIPSQNIVIINY